MSDLKCMIFKFIPDRKEEYLAEGVPDTTFCSFTVSLPFSLRDRSAVMHSQNP